MLAPELIEKHCWTEEDFDFAWTVALISGKSPDEVVRIYGGDPDGSVGHYHFAQLDDLQNLRTNDDPLIHHVQTFTAGGYTIAIESVGWTGSLPEMARRCSANGGTFFSVYWDIHRTLRLTQAEGGVVSAHTDPTMPEAQHRPEWLDLADFEYPKPERATSMAYLEQQTGLAFDQYWLNELRPTYRIPDPYWMLRDVPGAETP